MTIIKFVCGSLEGHSLAERGCDTGESSLVVLVGRGADLAVAAALRPHRIAGARAYCTQRRLAFLSAPGC